MTERFESQVFDGLVASYTTEELRTLCMRLGIADDRLNQGNRDVLARELIGYTGRRGQWPELITILRAERSHIDWPPVGAGLQPAPPIPLQRPPTATHFTGRAPELAALLDALQPNRIVTLYGPGGIGKTALAAEALQALAPGDAPPARFPGGVLFHTFYGRPAVSEAAAEMVRACGHDPNPDPWTALSAALRGRAALLILDGAEEADHLDALLARRERCAVLITSRRREDVVDVGIEVERLPPEEALALLAALAHPALRAGAAAPPAAVWAGAGEEAAAREVCELVGNLPLALRLVGAYLFQNGETAIDFRAWLSAAGLAALDFGARRRESVPVLMAKSVAQLSEGARAALGVAGCLALQPFDGAPLVAALALDERAARRVLGELVNYELLRRAGERYETTHALVHGYARERLPVAPEVLRRLGDSYAALAETESAKGLPGYQRLEPERGHVLAVLARLAAAGEWAAANRLVWAVHSWLDVQGYPRDRIAALEVGLAAARELGNKYDVGSHQMHIGLAHNDLGEVTIAIKRYEDAQVLFKETGDKQSQGNCLGNLGNAYRALGQVEQAIGQYEAALAIAREIGDRRGEGNHLGNLGNAYRNLGQVERAIEQHEAALAIAREIGDRRGEGNHLGNLGLAYADLGQVERAIAQYEAALAIAREIGDRRNEGNWLGNLGLAYADLGQVERAIAQYEAALAIAREIGDRRGEGADLGNLGLAYADLGQVERAIGQYEAALAIHREIGDRRGEGVSLNNLGFAFLAIDEVDKALDLCKQALAISREVGDRSNEAHTLDSLGSIYRKMGDIEQAKENYLSALAIFVEIQSPQAEDTRASLAALEE